MRERILITGGAGFIGSHLTDRLIESDYEVVILDNIEPAVHATAPEPPPHLNPAVHFMRGDVGDPAALAAAMEGVTVVFHFASLTGTTQSLYEIDRYSAVNIGGTAQLLMQLQPFKQQIRKVVLSSSRAVYGEGAYRHPDGHLVTPAPRSAAQLRQHDWEVRCPETGAILCPIPTAEDKQPDPGSFYAVSKLTQEQMLHIFGDTSGIPVVNLRFFNVYGPRQSLSNPYMGVIGFFATQLIYNRPVNVYEDGLPSRDFVHVNDVVDGCLATLQTDAADGHVVNIGSGVPLSLLDVATVLTDVLNGPPPQISKQFRVGDVRHCYADIRRAHRLLNYAPKVEFKQGITELLEAVMASGQLWADRSQDAAEELRQRGLGN